MANGNVVYEMATERILVELEKGVIPWRKPWAASGGAYNYKTGRKYMMINQMLLKHQDGYVTFNQCKKLGGKVKKGSKAEVVFEWFVKSVPAKGKDGGEILDENGKPVSKKIVRLTYDRVFWIGDCEDLPEKEMDDQKTDLVQIKDCEDVIKDYVKRSGIGFQNDRPSDRAYYSPASDKVVVPMLDQYSEGTEYYSTIFHELTHSTGHKSRLNRFSDEKAAAFGSDV